MKTKCDCCGKFRKQDEVVGMEGDSNDGWPGEQWLECKYCMSQSDLERYGFEPKKVENEV